MKIVVFGSGLVGSLYALLMSKLGHEIVVYEKRSDPRKGMAGRARSINLALSKRGATALELAGILEKVKSLCIPMEGRMIHTIGQETKLQAYSQFGDMINSISRNGLNELLIDEAEKTGKCTFVFETELLPSSSREALPQLKLKDNSIFTPVADLFIGADGANSIARSYIKDCKFSVDKISHNYKEIEIPAHNGQFALYKNALHIWPRGAYMFIGLPNLDASYTGTLFLPEVGENSFDSLRSEKDVEQFFADKFPDTLAHIPDLVDQFFSNPTSNLGTVWADDWYDEEKKIGLIGDAAHGIVPFYGQGMNAGFEDCSVLYDLLQRESFEGHFEKFATNRKKDTDAIAYLSMGNFIEMRDLVAQPEFQLQKKIEAKIQARFPDLWMPLYSMVSFSTIPYHKVYERAVVQQKIMDQILSLPKISESFTDLNAEILEVLAKNKIS